MQSISPMGSWRYESSATALQRLVRLAFALTCLGGLVLFAPAEAAAACTTSNVNHGNTNGGKTYRVNAVSLDLLTTIGSREAVSSAIHMSAATWNNHANAGYFRIGLSTSDTSLPSTKAACDAAGINYSLVVVKNQNGSKAVTSGACESGGVATQFVITINTKDSSGNLWDFRTHASVMGANQWDLVQTMTHEFGHTMRLGHPSTEDATMTPTTMGTNRSRDLYQWDLECAASISGHRSLTGYRYTHSASFSSESAFTSGTGWPVANVSVGVTSSATPGVWGWATSVKQSACTNWLSAFSPATAKCTSISTTVGMSPTEAVWREDTTNDRIFYADYLDLPTAYDASSTHRVAYRRSTNQFTSQVSGSLSSCTAMSGFFVCNGTTPVQSGKHVSVAWDNLHNRTVFAWVNQNRANNAQEREIRLAIGNIAHTTLPQHDSLGVQSSVTPGVACESFSAGGFDCIVAYVDQTNTANRVRTRRFYASAGANKYNLVLDPNVYDVSFAPTASRVAAWYNGTNSKFYIATRPQRVNELTEIFESTDGATWTFLQTLNASVVGPSAASVWEGPVNALVLAR
jgi:hypothetical protein